MKRKIITLEVDTEATHQEIKRYFTKKGKFVIKIDFETIPYATKHMTVIQCQVNAVKK